ncbi:MAG TPA: zf-HC2 domain-containing protein [Actinomycetota bacterium]|jgi:anti-sigma factor RsiW|nr:zf-HC2 domain-containing protein [Actinomycetota bacterium]
MSHPGQPLLADYVDGTLDPPTRAELDAHLRTCATCRDAVALSRAGVRAAQALGQPATPEGIGDAAIDEAARLTAERNPEITSMAGRARWRPTTSRILAAAGAAAVVLLLVVVGPRLGQGSSQDLADRVAGGAAQAQGVAAYPQATGVETHHVDFTFDALPHVVDQLRTAYVVNAGGAAPVAGIATPNAVGSTSVPSLPPQQDASTDPSLLPKATACLNKAFDSPTGTLTRVILATYQGEPAYLGVYLIGPGAELPPTLLQLNVASVHGCQPLGETTARL